MDFKAEAGPDNVVTIKVVGIGGAGMSAVSIGGDSDTIASITGSLAEAAFGVPDPIRTEGLSYLDPFQLDVLSDFEAFAERAKWKPKA